MSDQLIKVRHDYIRYANCWEDADVLIEGLDLNKDDRILSIGSAGDNSFSMLIHDPQLVVAVDINEIQLNLIELKKACFKTLTYHEFLKFLGFQESNDRLKIYNKIKTELSVEQITFWDLRLDELTEGIIYQGKFEKYFKLFRKRILPLIHTKKRINSLFEEKSSEEQVKFYHSKWNNFRWKLLFKIFFSRFVMGRFGRDPLFLKEVKVKVSEVIFNSAEKHLTSTLCQQNYLLQFILKGRFTTKLPHYARPENFDKIKSNINNIVIYKGLAEAAFKEYKGFNKFNLSNIFEYMDPNLFKDVADNLIKNGQGASRYAYWNLMVPRRMSKINSQVILDPNSQVLSSRDMGFFYQGLIIEVKE